VNFLKTALEKKFSGASGPDPPSPSNSGMSIGSPEPPRRMSLRSSVTKRKPSVL
jgi:hypothetical protein